MQQSGATNLFVQIVGAAALRRFARLAFDLLAVASYLHPANLVLAPVAFTVVGGSVLLVLVFASIRLVQRRFVFGVTLLAVCLIPFLVPRLISPQKWKFRG